MSILLLLALHFSHIPDINRTKNGFTRNLLNKQVNLLLEKKINFRASSIVYIDDSSIFLEKEATRGISILDRNNSVIKSIDLTSLVHFIKGRSYSYNIDAGFLYCFLADSRQMLQINLKTLDFHDTQLPKNTTRAMGFYNSKVIVRSFDSTNQNSIFKLLNLNNIVKECSDITANNNDGGLSTDGRLFMESNNSFYYMSFFINKIYRFDGNLNLISTFKTIDTNTVCKNSVKEIYKSKTFLFTGPLTIVNYQIAVGDRVVYIISGLRADNQRLKDYYNSTTIDLYNKINGVYLGSFQVSNDNGDHIKSFYAKQNKLFILFPKSLKEYNLNDKFFF